MLTILVTMVGCAPRFHSFDESRSDPNSFSMYRESPSGNAVAANETAIPDKLLFSRKLNGGIGAQVIGNDRFAVVPTFNKRLYFLDVTDGDEITSLVVQSSVANSPALVDELLYYAEEAGGDRLVCHNLVSGKQVWEFSVVDPQAAPVVYEEEVYISSRTGRLSQINRWLGSVNWEYDLDGIILSSPAVTSTHVLICNDQGRLLCLDRTTGDLIWEFHTEEAFRATPMVFAGVVYAGCTDGVMYALEENSGDLLWNLETAGQIVATPVAVGERLLIASNDRTLYCVNKDTGNLLWTYETDAILPASPIGLDGHFICASAAGMVRILDLNGRLRSSFEVDGMITAPPSLVANRLWISTRNRRIYCFGNQSLANSN